MLKLKYIKVRKDADGSRRYYFNRIGNPQTRLMGAPGQPGFMLAYHDALAASDRRSASPPPARPDTSAGTLSDLIARYYATAAYKALAPNTRRVYRNEIERLRIEHGHKPVALLDRKGVKALINAKGGKPGAANNLLKHLRILMGFAIDEEMRTDDPTARIKKLKVPGEGFRAWGEDDIAAFEARHAKGSRARLALALLLFTAQRRGDVVRLGPVNIKRGCVALRQSKTGSKLEIPIHPELAEALAWDEARGATFLRTRTGEPFVPAGFGNWFADCCRAAGLGVGFNAHGLRKAGARRLAEAGCSAHQIMSITGHKTLSEVDRYTRAASQPNLAGEAMRLVLAAKPGMQRAA